MIRNWRRVSGLATSLVMVCLVGCSLVDDSSVGDTSVRLSSAALPAMGDDDVIDLDAIDSGPFPLDGYRPTLDQRRQLTNALNRLVQLCAADHGVVVRPPPAPLPQGDFFALYAAPVRPLRVGDAREHGYHMPATAVPEASIVDGLSSSEQAIVGGWIPDGVSTAPTDPFLVGGGCFGLARGQLAGADDPGGTEAAIASVTRLIADAGQRVLADPRFLESTKQWAQCMTGRGYPGLTRTLDAFHDLDLNGPITAAEVSQATADAQCKEATGLGTTWARLTYAYQRQSVNEAADQLAAVREQLDLALQNAAAVLQGEPGR